MGSFYRIMQYLKTVEGVSDSNASIIHYNSYLCAFASCCPQFFCVFLCLYQKMPRIKMRMSHFMSSFTTCCAFSRG